MDKSKNCSKILLDKGPDFGNVNDIYFAFNSNSAFVPLQGRSFEMATEFKNKHILKRDDILDTPLHVAVMFGTNNEVLEILKDPKAHRYLNMQDRNGNTPLHLAVMESYFIVLRILGTKKHQCEYSEQRREYASAFGCDRTLQSCSSQNPETKEH